MLHVTQVQIHLCRPSSRPRSGRYDALDGSRHGCHIATGNRGTITLHTQNQRSSLLHTSQSPRLRTPAAAVLFSIAAVSLYHKYTGMVGRVFPHAYPRENPCLISSLFPPVTDSPNTHSPLQSITVRPSHPP